MQNAWVNFISFISGKNICDIIWCLRYIYSFNSGVCVKISNYLKSSHQFWSIMEMQFIKGNETYKLFIGRLYPLKYSIQNLGLNQRQILIATYFNINKSIILKFDDHGFDV